MTKRKICFLTGTRADYGHMYWIFDEIHKDPSLELQLIVTGMHLSPHFGLTKNCIIEDGFPISKEVEILSDTDDTPVSTARATGVGMIGFSEALDELKPDLFVVFGDRFEQLAAATSALILNIPCAHIHGGEITQGAFDDAIRHSLTKMSHIHYVAAKEYKKRLIQLGEDPKSVHCFGAPGLDHIEKMTFLSREQLSENLNFSFQEKIFLVTYHPVTLSLHQQKESITNLLMSLDHFQDVSIVFTMPNSDTENKIISEKISHYCEKNQGRAVAVTNLGQQRYLSIMRICHVVIGNSSSGIIEAPTIGVATVNIGIRQAGRLRASSIIDCGEDEKEITSSIKLALSDDFRSKLGNVEPLYGKGEASKKIKQHMKSVSLNNIILKDFYDLDFSI